MEVNQIFLRRFYEIFNLGFELYISGGDFSLRITIWPGPGKSP